MTWEEFMDMLKYETKAEVIDSRREEIALLIPEVRWMFDYDQNNSYHQYDLWMHCVHTALGLPRGLDDDMLYLAALLHDIGKPDCRCAGTKEGDTNSHYYGHPERSAQIVGEVVVPHLDKLGVELPFEDIKRLLYYVEYHDDHMSRRMKSLRRHMELTDMVTFKKLMQLQIADAKAHVIFPLVQERIDVCSLWLTEYAEEILEKMLRGE